MALSKVKHAVYLGTGAPFGAQNDSPDASVVSSLVSGSETFLQSSNGRTAAFESS